MIPAGACWFFMGNEHNFRLCKRGKREEQKEKKEVNRQESTQCGGASHDLIRGRDISIHPLKTTDSSLGRGVPESVPNNT